MEAMKVPLEKLGGVLERNGRGDAQTQIPGAGARSAGNRSAATQGGGRIVGVGNEGAWQQAAAGQSFGAIAHRDAPTGDETGSAGESRVDLPGLPSAQALGLRKGEQAVRTIPVADDPIDRRPAAVIEPERRVGVDERATGR